MTTGLTRRSRVVALTAALMLVAAACSSEGGGADVPADIVADDNAAAAEAANLAAAAPVDYVGSMSLEPVTGLPGTTVTVVGEGLPPSTAFDLSWGTAEGRWVLEGGMDEEYHGRVYDPVSVSLGTVQSDASGGLDTDFVVPAGFGFAHDVVLTDADGVIRNQALFTVEMEVSISPTEGPVGTPITIEVNGMGWKTLENNRTVIYDNAFTGWLSSVTTDGIARTIIPATGSPGPHRIDVARGAFTFPYLNPQQSPRPDIPVFTYVFTVTDGEPVMPPSLDQQNPQVVVSGGVSEQDSGPSIATDVLSGPVGTPFVLTGSALTPGATVSVVWYRIVGNRVSGEGWEERSLDIGEVTVDADGTFEFPTAAPDRDVGGPHRIEAIVDGTVAASTFFSISPNARSIEPASGPWGTDITILLTGVGWTETSNIHTIVYDNAYIGYACGFNSQGFVEVVLKATGEPGWHFIDLYPAIYKGKETSGQQSFRIPQLTFADDHPGEDLPAFHFAFYLEG